MVYYNPGEWMKLMNYSVNDTKLYSDKGYPSAPMRSRSLYPSITSSDALRGATCD